MFVTPIERNATEDSNLTKYAKSPTIQLTGF